MRAIIHVVIALASTSCVHPDDSEDAGSAQRAKLKQKYEALAKQLQIDCSPQPQRDVGTTCDADALADRATTESWCERPREALRLFEASLACKFDANVARHAYHAACESKNAASARAHYQEMAVDPEKRDLERAACVAYGVDPVN